MGFDLNTLTRAVAAHGVVARVVVAEVQGSAPREVGAAMLVWSTSQSGTIGGGALEFQAAVAARARRLTGDGTPWLSRHPLGPALGQCCGGAVALLTEVYDAAALGKLAESEIIARSVTGTGEMPLSVRRILRQGRGTGTAPAPQLIDGWMVEPLHRPTRPVWIWGAGHVGRAIAATLAPLPEFSVTLIDTAADRLPDPLPEGVTPLVAADPARLVTHAPADAEHLILTFSHALDLELCHRLLGRDFAFAGLIGSASKRARFRSRLAALGHSAERINRLHCPIGQPDLGKHPQAIAIGVAAELLQKTTQTAESKRPTGEKTA